MIWGVIKNTFIVSSLIFYNTFYGLRILKNPKTTYVSKALRIKISDYGPMIGFGKMAQQPPPQKKRFHCSNHNGTFLPDIQNFKAPHI